MPIRQPVSKTIHLNDFRDHTFSFPVESILKPQQGAGKLIISASPGYLLTTSPDHEPTPEQTLEHVLQPDGNRIARGTITLLANDGPLADSTVTIRNPSGETVILTVDSTPETALITQAPTLQVSASALTFAKTTPGKPLFMVFAVAQQNTATPVTITSDEPTVFQVASDNRPAFAPKLTLVPSPTGTYVHVRYFPGKAGRSEAHLTIETAYTSQSVALTGRSGGWLPVGRNPRTARRPETNLLTKSVPATPRFWLMALLIGGLAAAIAGYQFRCQLVPGLCREANHSVTIETPVPKVARPKVERGVSVARTPSPKLRESVKTARVPGPTTEATKAIPEKRSPVALPVTPKPLTDQTDEQTNQPVTNTVRTRSTRKAPVRSSANLTPAESFAQPAVTPVLTPTTESELERELNQKPTNQKSVIPKSVNQ